MSAPPPRATPTLAKPPDRVDPRVGPVVIELAPLAVLAINGPDASVFLHGQLSSDVNGLASDASQYTSFNSPKGRMLANFVLWRDGEQDFRALLPAELADPVRKRLSMYVLRSKVVLTDVSAESARFGVGGPGAPEAVRSAVGVVPGTFAVGRVDGATILALPGPRFVLLAAAGAGGAWREQLERLATPAAFSVWQWLTIRAGVPVVTAATQDHFVAQTANWDLLGGVNFHKGCYTGQEIIARMQYLGRLKERLFMLHADAPPPAAGTRVFSAAFGAQACGTVVNAAASPAGGCDLLAVVQLAATESADLHLDSLAGPVLAPQPLPYEIPPPEAPRARTGPAS